jgi:ferric-dicitrate binding protein FerR (iron transport regulator)
MQTEDRDRDRGVDRRLLLAACATALLPVAPGIAHAESAGAAGAVEDLRGEAFAEARAVRRVLTQAAPLYVGDNVGTGAQSRLTVQLGRDTRLRLGEQTRITIDRFLVNAGGEITLRSGPVLFDRPAGAPPAPMQIRSPFGLIAVRGTRFFAGPSRGVFGVFVERGSVAVSAAGRRVVLAVGEGTDIARPGAAPTPPAKWGQPRIDAALASVF